MVYAPEWRCCSFCEIERVYAHTGMVARDFVTGIPVVISNCCVLFV
jgi:hypothetical protein